MNNEINTLTPKQRRAKLEAEAKNLSRQRFDGNLNYAFMFGYVAAKLEEAYQENADLFADCLRNVRKLRADIEALESDAVHAREID
jgi:hypothetical protein